MIKYRPAEKKDNVVLAALIRNIFDEFDLPKQGTIYSDSSTDDLYALFEHERSELYVVERDV